MVRTTEEMLAFAVANGVVVQFRRQEAPGAYLRIPGVPPHISLDVGLVHMPIALRCTLAEALGLHFTREEAEVIARTSYNAQARYVQANEAALKWAMAYLMDAVEVTLLYRQGMTIEEMAKLYQVPPGWVKARLEQIGVACYAWATPVNQ